jgi:hypothetical protein
MTDERLLELVNESLEATQQQLLGGVMAYREKRPELLAMLDALPTLGAQLINNVMRELKPDAKH